MYVANKSMGDAGGRKLWLSMLQGGLTLKPSKVLIVSTHRRRGRK